MINDISLMPEKDPPVKFVEGRNYFSDTGYEFFVTNRFNHKDLLRGYIGFALEANYKIRTDRSGNEYITAKGHVFKAAF